MIRHSLRELRSGLPIYFTQIDCIINSKCVSFISEREQVFDFDFLLKFSF